VTVPEIAGPVEHTVEATIVDGTAELVCRVRAVWRLDVRG
jgi:hypothetical protein